MRILHLLGTGERADELDTCVMREFAAVPFGTPVDGQVMQVPASSRHMLAELAHGNIVDLLADPVDPAADAAEPRILVRRVTHQYVDDLLRGVGPRVTRYRVPWMSWLTTVFVPMATRATASSPIITALLGTGHARVAVNVPGLLRARKNQSALSRASAAADRTIWSPWCRRQG